MLPQNMPFRHKDYSELNVNKKKQMQEKLCSQLPLSPTPSLTQTRKDRMILLSIFFYFI